MGDSPKTTGRAGATPKKLALIAVLAVVLIAVLYVQFGRSSDQETPVAATGGEAAPAANRAAIKAITNPSGKATTPATENKEWLLETIDRPQWKSPELARVVRYDPFALPAAFPQPAGTGIGAAATVEGGVVVANAESTEDLRAQAIAEIQTKLASLKQRGVRVIIDGQKQTAAIVGDRTIHVGDDIEGFTVKAIDSDGVVVERKLD